MGYDETFFDVTDRQKFLDTFTYNYVVYGLQRKFKIVE